MMSDTELPRLMQLTLNETEAMYMGWALIAAKSSVVGDVMGAVRAHTALAAMVRDNRHDVNSLIGKFRRLGHAAFASEELKGLPCPHCECESEICCYCLQPKQPDPSDT